MSNAKVTIIGEDRASKQVGDVGRELEKAASHGAAFGAVVGTAFVGVASKLSAFAKTSIDAFAEVGSQTAKLQRYIGGTAESASRLRFAAQESGVGFDDLTKGLGILSKHLAGNDAAAKSLGVAYRDAHGQILPMDQLLPKIAQKFASMSNGPAKTAAVLKEFGKGGMALLPFLNKGAAGMGDLERQSDKLGNTLNQKDLAAVKKVTVAKREWHATVEGLQIQLGRNLYPALTKVTEGLTQATLWVEKNKSTVVPLVGVLGGFAVAVWSINKATEAWAATQKALAVIFPVVEGEQWSLNAAMDANPIGMVVVALGALAAGFIYAYKHSETFRNIVQGAFADVRVAFSVCWDALKAGFGWISDHWKLLASILTGPIGAAVIGIASHWSSIVDGAKAVVRTLGSVFRTVTSVITAPFRGAFNAIADAWNHTLGSVSFHVPKWVPEFGGDGFSFPRMPHLAAGGIVTRPTVALIGEAGPEAVIPLSRRGGGSPMGDIHIHLNGPVFGADKKRIAEELVDEMSRAMRNRQRNGGFGPIPSTG